MEGPLVSRTLISRIGEIPQSMQIQMRGVSWHQDIASPPLDSMRLLEIPYLNFENKDALGLLITSKHLSEEIIQIFSKLRAIAFPIDSIRPIYEFCGDDGQSMAANNSSCFNSRSIINTDRLSLHSYGAAIDINPIQNPVVRDGRYRPEAGRPYLNREQQKPGMLFSKSKAVQIFAEAGWKWGGHWGNPKDYHHFYTDIPKR